MRNFFRNMLSARYLAKGDRQSQIGNYEKALEYYHASLEIDEDPMVPYYCIAHSLAKLGRYEESRTYINKSLGKYQKFVSEGGALQDFDNKLNEVLYYLDHMEQKELGRI